MIIGENPINDIYRHFPSRIIYRKLTSSEVTPGGGGKKIKMDDGDGGSLEIKKTKSDKLR